MRRMIRALVIGLGVAGFALAGAAPVEAQSTLKEKAAAVKEKAKARYQKAKQAVKERVSRVKEKVAEKKAVVAAKVKEAKAVVVKKAAAKPVKVYKAKPAPRRVVKKRYAKCKGIAGKGYGLGKEIATTFALEALKNAAAKYGPGRLSKPRVACSADNISCIAKAKLCR